MNNSFYNLFLIFLTLHIVAHRFNYLISKFQQFDVMIMDLQHSGHFL